jgi:hypothetical protein
MAAHIIRPLGKHHSADAGPPGGPGLDLDDYFVAFLAAGEFLGHQHSIIRRKDGAAAWNLESVGGENGLALIFVKSCHGSVLFHDLN